MATEVILDESGNVIGEYVNAGAGIVSRTYYSVNGEVDRIEVTNEIALTEPVTQLDAVEEFFMTTKDATSVEQIADAAEVAYTYIMDASGYVDLYSDVY